MPYDINDLDDNENGKDGDDNDDDGDDEDDDLSPVLIKSEEADYTCWFEAFQFSCATTWIYNQINIVWFHLNGFLFGLEWI